MCATNKVSLLLGYHLRILRLLKLSVSTTTLRDGSTFNKFAVPIVKGDNSINAQELFLPTKNDFVSVFRFPVVSLIITINSTFCPTSVMKSFLQMASNNDNNNEPESITHESSVNSDKSMNRKGNQKQTVLHSSLLNQVRDFVKTSYSPEEFSCTLDDSDSQHCQCSKEQLVIGERLENVLRNDDASTYNEGDDFLDNILIETASLSDDQAPLPPSTRKPKRTKRKTSDNQKNTTNEGKVQKLRPNHFVAVQITNPEILDQLKCVQEKARNLDPHVALTFVPIAKLHLTLQVFHLAKNDMDKARAALVCSGHRIRELLDSTELNLSVCGMGNFKNNVVFAKLNNDQGLTHLSSIADIVAECFTEACLLTTDSKAFTPHITLMKLSRVSPRKLKELQLKKIDASLYEEFIDCEFGVEHVTTVQLCSMLKNDKTTGYYHVEHAVNIGQDNGEQERSENPGPNNKEDSATESKPSSKMVSIVTPMIKRHLHWTFLPGASLLNHPNG